MDILFIRCLWRLIAINKFASTDISQHESTESRPAIPHTVYDLLRQRRINCGIFIQALHSQNTHTLVFFERVTNRQTERQHIGKSLKGFPCTFEHVLPGVRLPKRTGGRRFWSLNFIFTSHHHVSTSAPLNYSLIPGLCRPDTYLVTMERGSECVGEGIIKNLIWLPRYVFQLIYLQEQSHYNDWWLGIVWTFPGNRINIRHSS